MVYKERLKSMADFEQTRKKMALKNIMTDEKSIPKNQQFLFPKFSDLTFLEEPNPIQLSQPSSPSLNLESAYVNETGSEKMYMSSPGIDLPALIRPIAFRHPLVPYHGSTIQQIPPNVSFSYSANWKWIQSGRSTGAVDWISAPSLSSDPTMQVDDIKGSTSQPNPKKRKRNLET